MIPNIDDSVSFPMLFVIGLLTSIHCISMCGAFNLIAIYDSKKNYKRPIMYNTGRIISYTIIGGLVGLFGNLFKINNIANGIIIIFIIFNNDFNVFKYDWYIRF
jgi:sulfite exporter TauE/SafE